MRAMARLLDSLPWRRADASRRRAAARAVVPHRVWQGLVMRKTMVGPVLLMLFLAAACAPEVSVPTAGRAMPSFTAASLDGGAEVTFAELVGETVVLNVWATWCTPCRQEMPALERLHRLYGGRGLRVVAVSVDRAGAEGEIRDFVAEHDLTFDILHDPAGDIQRRYGLRGLPETFLIGPDGVLRRHWIGRIDPFAPAILDQVHAALRS
jgi:cytochrome c biogenesis protein CcmG, thiol:disulfide interchange protein DsbE